MIFIDPPAVPAHGRLWSHLVSDTSFEELHAFARELGVPERGFERDRPHPSGGRCPRDVPDRLYAAAVAAGAVPVSSREVVARLTSAGLRRRKGARAPQGRGELREEVPLRTESVQLGP